MEKKTQDEMIELLLKIANAITNHAKPSKYDWIMMAVSCLGTIISVCAIFVAVQIPKQVAEQQNKIALFEKRYSVYHELKIINDFLDGYYDTCAVASGSLPIELSQQQREAIYYKSLWEGEIHKNQYSINDDIGAILKQQSQIIDSLSLVFYNITSDEETLCKDFFNTYLVMTQQYVLVSSADRYISISDFDDEYNRLDLTDILKKMKQQLRL